MSGEHPLRRQYPILEFDPHPKALINPRADVPAGRLPDRCVICFFEDVFRRLQTEGRLEQVACDRSEMGQHPVYGLTWKGEQLACFHPGLGAPLAGALLEHAIAGGSTKFVAVGGAGVLNRNIAVGHLLVPIHAVRDEGMSYHYLPPSRTVAASPAAVAAIECVLQQHGLAYHTITTWTTDAIFRETPDKIALRRQEGCVTVEMEAAAFFAVAQFRGVDLGQILYAGDDVGGEVWDGRRWADRTAIREHLFELACDAVLEI